MLLYELVDDETGLADLNFSVGVPPVLEGFSVVHEGVLNIRVDFVKLLLSCVVKGLFGRVKICY